MSEGSYPSVPGETPGDAAGFATTTSDGEADTTAYADVPPPPPPAPPSRGELKTRRLIWMLAILIVVGLPVAVGLATFFSPAPLATEESADLGELSSAAPSRATETENIAGPRWVRPSWADAVPGSTVFELPAGSDVLFANGRHRPTLGISCVDGRTDVHVSTGGTAPIDPETSGHVVKLTFDSRNPQPQQWAAAQDQRALFAPDALTLAAQIASSRRLSFGFTHYMSGAVEVEFDLRGANEVITSMAEPCGWGD